ncbi:MAG: hypothetical protein GF317_01910 [Candidatus Lokiarchaeota archaeon]|nr:hypothetical protein [Candidatus Lokiarchaeota archaeon]MBD3198696.1 hypothetical protein [Candidatus Lokiarchaeota archaeon]
MREWQVILNYNNGKKKEIKLYDAERYFDGYLKIKRRYFSSLVQKIKTTQNYFIVKGIEKVISPKEKDWTANPWVLLLIKDFEKDKSFWLLMKREKDLSGLVIAIGPKEFAKYNNNNSEAKREIMRIFNYLIAYMNKFKCAIIIPNYIKKIIVENPTED